MYTGKILLKGSPRYFARTDGFCGGIEYLLTKLGKILEKPKQDGHPTSALNEAKS